MPRRVSLVVLGEDDLHDAFSAAFLKASRLPVRGSARFVPGGNSQGVVAQFEEQARAMLRAGAETHLIVMIDADGRAYADVRRWLLRAIEDPKLRKRVAASPRWLLVSPAWELENWVHCLEGRAVAEERDLGLTLDLDKECRPAARRLAEYCARREAIPNALPSLENACGEWRRYVERNAL